MLASQVAELTAELHANISTTVQRRAAMLSDRQAVLEQILTEADHRMKEMDKGWAEAFTTSIQFGCT